VEDNKEKKEFIKFSYQTTNHTMQTYNYRSLDINLTHFTVT